MWSTTGRALGHLLEIPRNASNHKVNGIAVYKNRLAVIYETKLECKNLDRLPLNEKVKSLRRKKWILVFAACIIAVGILLVIILVTTNKLHIE